ncbi:MAG TPA: DUF2007 domain-containing protein [Steroidobacteraceae bacterium]|nr:DUF2007 domain-containing protein [Steroidobacteraceae bacterium]
METLTHSVYECTLAVEAHMICDLLARNGISSNVDGEFLAGAGGELPLGNTIKVRVDPLRAVEARAVISEWERLQPPEPIPPPPRSTWRSPLWFLGGILAGGAVMFLALRTPYSGESADLNGDGVVDEKYHYTGQVIDRVEYDRNADGKIDARWINDMYGVPEKFEGDDDFDGRFEWKTDAVRGWSVRSEQDADGDGRPERVFRLSLGVMHTEDIYDEAGTRVVVRQHFDNARLVAREFDKDGDGVFERRVEFDRFGEPLPVQSAGP